MLALTIVIMSEGYTTIELKHLILNSTQFWFLIPTPTHNLTQKPYKSRGCGVKMRFKAILKGWLHQEQ